MVEESLKTLKRYCESEGFKGWDPYDGLNSWVVQRTPLGKSRFFRLAWIQLFKRNPINLRNIFGVKKGHNPKGLALFLIGYCKLYEIEPDEKSHLTRIHELAEKIVDLVSTGYSGACWGYNFDWQARAFFQPKGMPTIVATSFVVESLFLAYELTNKEEYRDIALSSSGFVLNDLNKTYDDEGNYTLSYSPMDQTQVFNAGLLGAKLLSQCVKYGAPKSLLNEARKICNYVCQKQNKDGSWAYSLLNYHQWIDSFHTGFNLECIHSYQKISGDKTFSTNLKRGTIYYLENFFHEDGRAKYYNNKTYPIDIHAPAQIIVTLIKMGIYAENKDLVKRVISWTINNMQDKKGYFYYQKRKGISSKIPYMRWAQSWMFYSLTYLKKEVYAKN